MNELTDELCTRMTPVAALIAYKMESRRNSDKYFVEARRIGDDGVMGEAAPVSYELMNEIASNYSEVHNAVPHGRLPENLLYADTRKGSERYVWYNLPRHRMMYFASRLAIENGEYNVPGIVYSVKNGQLCVFAIKDEKPDLETTLYQAPFFNVSSPSGSVCLGSAQLSKPTNPSFADILEFWEKKFWLTEFTHLGGGTNPTAGNLVLVTKEARDNPFPVKELKSSNRKLKDLLR